MGLEQKREGEKGRRSKREEEQEGGEQEEGGGAIGRWSKREEE